MKKLFEKKEVLFAVLLIIVYVVGSSVMLNISELIGIKFLGELVFDAVLTAVIFVFIRNNGLMRYFGLCGSEVRAAKMLFYIPMFMVSGMTALFGLGFEYDALGMVLHTVTMLLVGFLEEVIFRGFLFRAMAKTNLTAAVIVTSVTFGMGHIINLVNGYEIFDNLVQIVYAVAVGFMLVFVLMRTGSLIPCIVFHAFNNCLTAFTTGDVLTSIFGSKQTGDLVLVSAMIVLTLAYTLYVMKALPKRKLAAA